VAAVKKSLAATSQPEAPKTQPADEPERARYLGPPEPVPGARAPGAAVDVPIRIVPVDGDVMPAPPPGGKKMDASPTTQPGGPLGLVLSELRKIQPPMYDAAGVEEALMVRGKESLAALRQARALGTKIVGDDELTTNRYSVPGQGTVVIDSPREARVKELAEVRLGVLDRAITRIDFGFNPPEVVAKWVESREPKASPLPGPPQPLSSPAAGKAFPDFAWCIAVKGYSPVERADEQESSWPNRNLFAVDRKSNVTHIGDAKALEGFFRKNAAAVKTEADATLAVEAWLSLSQTLQDHAAFPVEKDSLKAAKQEGGGWVAEGRASAGMG
jgi:hypothetical protein